MVAVFFSLLFESFCFFIQISHNFTFYLLLKYCQWFLILCTICIVTFFFVTLLKDNIFVCTGVQALFTWHPDFSLTWLGLDPLTPRRLESGTGCTTNWSCFKLDYNIFIHFTNIIFHCRKNANYWRTWIIIFWNNNYVSKLCVTNS